MVKIKELRLSKNLSQSELAKILGCNQTAIGKYERGQLEPNVNSLIKLADFFNCSIDYLVEREDDFGNVILSAGNGAELSRDEKELLRLFNKLGPFEREAIVIQMEALAENQPIKK